MSARTLAPLEAARYARQLLLPEIGEEGQLRIVAAEAAVDGAGLAHLVARRYALRAGFGRVVAGEIARDAGADAIVRTPAAQQVLAGFGRRSPQFVLRSEVVGAKATEPAASPWIRGGLVIHKAVLEAVEQDALRGYAADEEACGYLRGPADAPLVCDEAVSLENVANKLHRIDPETYFRTGRTFFAFNEKKFDDAVRGARDERRPVKVLYHSHLDAGAYFSPTDRAVMSMGEPPAEEGGDITLGPGPAWPLAFLVTSVRQGVVDDHKLFVWDGSDFVDSPFTVAD